MLFRQGMGFIIAIILARLLTPEDFGTIALLALFLGIANLFADAGFSAALIQSQDATHVDESTVFWFNLVAALVITLLLFAISPWIAGFFALPVLVPLMMLMACTVFISALGSIHGTLMTKRLDFKTPMKIGVISTLVSGGVGVCMAWKGYGIWALAGRAVTQSLVGAFCMWLFSVWRPLFAFSIDSFKRLSGFSGYIFAASLLHVIYTRGYAILIGKLFGVRELGFYNRAETVQQYVSGVLTGVVSRVTFPLYSSLSQDTDQLRRVVRMSIRSMMLLSAPTMIGLAVVADTFVPILLGQQWMPTVPILQVLCFAGVFLPLHSANVSVLKAQGRADLNLRLNIVKKLTGITFLGLGSFYGVMGVAWGCVCQSLVALIINGHYTKKLLGYGALEQVRDSLSSLVSSLLMAVAIILVNTAFDLNGATKLMISIMTGAGFYIAINSIFSVSAFREAIGLLKKAKA